MPRQKGAMGKNPNPKFRTRIKNPDGSLQYQYADQRKRPERNTRRFIPLERNDETDALVEAARQKIAAERGVPVEKVAQAEAIREALRTFNKGGQ